RRGGRRQPGDRDDKRHVRRAVPPVRRGANPVRVTAIRLPDSPVPTRQAAPGTGCVTQGGTTMADIGKPQRIIEIPKETTVPETVPAHERRAEQPKEPSPARRAITSGRRTKRYGSGTCQ